MVDEAKVSKLKLTEKENGLTVEVEATEETWPSVMGEAVFPRMEFGDSCGDFELSDLWKPKEKSNG